MTLAQFSAARRAVDDLPSALPAEVCPELYAGPGIIYPGDLVIELCADSDDYCLTIGNSQQTGTLAELEAELYRWAVAEEVVS